MNFCSSLWTSSFYTMLQGCFTSFSSFSPHGEKTFFNVHCPQELLRTDMRDLWSQTRYFLSVL